MRLVDVNAQFRAGGSDAYLDWVLRLLGPFGDGAVSWHHEERLAVEVVNSPHGSRDG